MTSIQLGIERIGEPEYRRLLDHQKIGLLLNQASVDHSLTLSAYHFARHFPGQLKMLFSPQHGIWGEQQANMLESPHGYLNELELPVMSLYSESRRPTAEMLQDIDCIVIDLQDVGTRVYTFIWTMQEILLAAEEYGKRVVVLDRPNPLGGTVFEGPILDENFRSFVGGWTLPMRHGLTIAEIAKLLLVEQKISVDLDVVPMAGWRRSMYFSDTGRSWLWPSPNMPTLTTTLLYPGQVLLEGVNLSEGRGTTRPFELIGAPYVDSRKWLESMAECPQEVLDAVRLLPTKFQPTFDKWKGLSCHGLDIQITNAGQVRSFALVVSLLATAAKLFPEFQWLDPPYEYEFIKPPIDILFGNERLRLAISNYCNDKIDLQQVLKEGACDQTIWSDRISKVIMYN